MNDRESTTPPLSEAALTAGVRSHASILMSDVMNTTARHTLISHSLCPYVQRAAIALREKGVDFLRVDIDLSNKPDWFLAISPLGKTPLLQVDGEVIFESAVICEYLDETIEPRMHSMDPLQRAHHRGWIEFASATLNTLWALYTAKDEAGFTVRRAELADKLRQLETVLGNGPYFAGERFGLVDAAFAPAFRYLDVFDSVIELVDYAALPRLRAWRTALTARPSVRAAVGADYAERLRAFVIKQQGYLGELFEAQATVPA